MNPVRSVEALLPQLPKAVSVVARNNQFGNKAM